jgi:hypothetical protein
VLGEADAIGSKDEVADVCHKPSAIADQLVRLARFLKRQNGQLPIQPEQLAARMGPELREFLGTIASSMAIKSVAGTDELSQYALINEAARLVGVHLRAVQQAIEYERLGTRVLGSGRKVVNIEDCLRLWPKDRQRRQKRKRPN